MRIAQQELRINDRIRVPRVRVVSAEGEQVGILETKDALEMADEQDLDLVEVAPQADPPVCRIMDYGKYKYEQDVKQRESRKKQTNVVVKEMKMRPKIDRHDYETKKGHVIRFLRQGAKVKVTIMFRGRETARAELGYRLLEKLSEDVADIAKVDTAPPPKPHGRAAREELRPAPTAEEPAEVEAEAAEPEPEADERPKRPVKITRAEGG